MHGDQYSAGTEQGGNTARRTASGLHPEPPQGFRQVATP